MQIPQATLELVKKFELTKENKFLDFQLAGKIISDFVGKFVSYKPN